MSPYLTTEDVVALYRFPNVRAAYKWLRSKGVPSDKRGERIRLWDAKTIQKLIEKRAA